MAVQTAPTLVPSTDVLPDVLPTDRLNERGMPTRELRAELRQINDVANIFTVLSTMAQSFGVVIIAGLLHTWWAYVIAFFILGGSHARLNILGHESAHRLLFSNRRVNDFVGRWFLGYPTFLSLLRYRRVHFAHHRDEMGPEEPDLQLYAGYPISRDSWHRKLKRDISGQSAYKNFRGLYRSLRRGSKDARAIFAVQVVMIGISVVVSRPLMYVVWILAWSTLWRVSNRARAIAEHGGMIRSTDRRLTTHVIRQSLIARMWFVPYNTGWHLAHHADMGVPWRNLPRLHDELVASGWIVDDIEHPSYWSFLQTATSRS